MGKKLDGMGALSHQIWGDKYRLKDAAGQPVDGSVEDTFLRVARGLAKAEEDVEAWSARFADAMDDFRFIPAGRILSGAGADRNVTLFNCFVMGKVPDSLDGIFSELSRSAVTMQAGGGIGVDFSTLRPKGAAVRGVGAVSSGPLPFMDTWDSMCRTIMSAGSRRGAMMAVMRCDHPDIEAFIDAKREPGRLRMFNLSVLVTDAFVKAVENDESWELVFGGAVYKALPARDLWEKIMRSTYEFAEPGVIFIDRVNKVNNLSYCETISATNPCGEIPAPPYGVCCLGSLNLAKLVKDPFSDHAGLDLEALEGLVGTAVRMLDNVIEVSRYPLPEQEHEAKTKRRIGLGFTGLADALIMCGVRYGAPGSVKLAAQWAEAIKIAAYRASVDLAREKGPFPLFDRDAFLSAPMVAGLPEDLRGEIAKHGIRNGLLTSIAPTGTISLFAGNVSSGIEPAFSWSAVRTILEPDGSSRKVEVEDYAHRAWRRLHGDAELPDFFVTAQDLAPEDHLAIQAAVQKHVDSSISKTINVPEGILFDDFVGIYRAAYDGGCKGCTTYRPNDVTGSILETKREAKKDDPELPLPMPKKVGSDGPVVHMFEPLARPHAVDGKTYKLAWPESDHATYITVNDIVDDQGRQRPFEVFINSKNMEHFAWTVALTRMISAVFRRGGDVSFVVEELKAVFDPRGGQWVDGKYVPSILAAIGEVVEKHMVAIGFLRRGEEDDPDREAKTVELAATGATGRPRFTNTGGDPHPFGGSPGTDGSVPRGVGRQCPKCGQMSLVRQEGCDSCTECTYSKCG